MTFKEKEFTTKNGNTYLINYFDGDVIFDEYVVAYICKKNKDNIKDNITSIDVSLGVDIDESEIEVSSYQGEPTYVPYGSTSVMYDDGFEIEDVDCSNAVYVIEDDPVITFEDEEGNQVEYDTTEEMKEILGDDFNEVWSAVYDYINYVALEQAQDYYEENAYDLID